MNDNSLNSVCCVIVTYNIGKRFYNCFNAIKGQTEKIVIVDNGSNAETIEVLKDLEKFEFVHVIYNKDNLGIADALNKGVLYAKDKGYRWVLTMDNDSRATPDMVNKMLKLYDAVPEKDRELVVSIFPSYVEETFLSSEEAEKLNKNEFTYKEVLNEITSGNLVKTEVFDKVGLFLEELFIDYVDIEFCFRLRKEGYKLIQINEVFLIHNLGAPIRVNFLGLKFTTTNHSYVRRYYMTRNRLYIWKLYFSYFPKFVFEDISRATKEFIKIILGEPDKKLKLKMILKAFKDACFKKLGKLNL